MEKMDADSVLDHRLGQLLWLGCAGRNWWTSGQRAYSRRDLADEPGEFQIWSTYSHSSNHQYQAYEPQRWHQFLIYLAYNIVAFIINALMNNILPYVTKAACEYTSVVRKDQC